MLMVFDDVAWVVLPAITLLIPAIVHQTIAPLLTVMIVVTVELDRLIKVALWSHIGQSMPLVHHELVPLSHLAPL